VSCMQFVLNYLQCTVLADSNNNPVVMMVASLHLVQFSDPNYFPGDIVYRTLDVRAHMLAGVPFDMHCQNPAWESTSFATPRHMGCLVTIDHAYALYGGTLRCTIHVLMCVCAGGRYNGTDSNHQFDVYDYVDNITLSGDPVKVIATLSSFNLSAPRALPVS
jgi:hypothetical protein